MYNRNLVFWAACLGMLVFGIVMLSLGTINIFIAEQFKDSNPDIASLAVFLPLGIFIGSLTFGPIIDRYGYKNLLIFCILLIAGGIEGIAYAADFRLVQLSFFIIGLGGGVINGGTNALVADISDTEKGAKLSLLGAFFGFGALGMPVVVGFLQNYFSFLTIIKVIGLIIFLTIVYFLLIRFPEAKQKTRNSSVNGFKLLKSPLLLLIGLILFFESGIEGLMNNWTALYLSSHLQTAPDATLYALSFIVIGMTGMRLILGFTLKYIRDHLMLYGSYGLILIGTVIVMFVPSYTTILVGLTMIGAGFAAVFPILLGYVGNLFAEASGTAFSIVFGIALIGNMLINAAVGIVNRHFGIQYYLVVLLVGLIFQVLFFTIIAKKITTKVNA
jgi:fucose permease